MKTSVATPTQLVYRLPYFRDRKTFGRLRSTLRASANEIATYRLKVIGFQEKHGVAATQDAFGISKATVLRWKQTLKKAKGRLESLIPRSKAPHRKRTMLTPPRILSFIAELRGRHGRLGKEKIKPLLDEYCHAQGLPTLSVSTIGKVIQRNQLLVSSKRIYHDPSVRRTQRRYTKIRVKRTPKPDQVGHVQMDSIIRFLDGMRFYLINAVDIASKFQFSYAYPRLTSHNALDFLNKRQTVYPCESGIKVVQTDNGSEFLGAFSVALQERKIPHLAGYPKSPKINAFVERANRTLQEEFVEQYLDFALTDLPEFNRHLMDYLVWFNTKRVHRSLGNITPIQYLLNINPKSQMYMTHTTS